MISVVIPTRDRGDELERTLRGLERQHAPEGGFEVVVADNGSRDGTARAVRALASRSEMELRVVEEPRPGPAAARNRGVEEALGETILFLGDDTEPAGDDLIVAHARLHDERGGERLGVLGGVAWSERQEVTPFLAWLEDAGYQFDFGGLGDGPLAARDAFWTAHVSLSRALFERAGGFDDRFPFAAVEDVELGARLDEQDITLEHHPELVVRHTHPIDLPASLERQRRVGRSAALMNEIHPEIDVPGLPEPSRVRAALLGATGPVWQALSGPAVPRRLRHGAWKARHLKAYAEGFRQGPPPAARS